MPLPTDSTAMAENATESPPLKFSQLPASVPFAPKMLLGTNAEKHLLIGTNGELLWLDNNFNPLGEERIPFPTPLTKACVCKDEIIGVWIDHEIQTARLAAIKIEGEIEQGVGRDEVRLNTKQSYSTAIHVKGAVWSHALTAEPLALNSIGDCYAFALWQKGIYFHSPNSEPIWSRGELSWPEIAKYKRAEELSFLHQHKGNIMAWSRGGGWAELSAENGEVIRQGVLEIPEPLTGVFYSEEGKWLLSCGDSAIRINLLEEQESASTVKLAGPINHANWSGESNSWKIAGWRQDIIWGESIAWEMRDELGIHVCKIGEAWCVLDNNGNWSKHLGK